MFEMFIQGAGEYFNMTCILLTLLGVIAGIVFGAIPGLSATMAIALFLPVTYNMNSMQGITLLVSLYVGGVSGGLISAILMKIPGAPGSIATCWDGGKMAENGHARRALGIGVLYSFFGGILSALALIFIAPSLADFAVKFGYPEYFAIAVFSLTLIASVSSKNIFKGVLAGLLGILLSTVGYSAVDGSLRFTFGITQLNGGFDILTVLIGFFAISEVILAAEQVGRTSENTTVRKAMDAIHGWGVSWKEFKEQFRNMITSFAIGLGIGILPGLGGATANVLAYEAVKGTSKYPEKFGTGIIDGVVASETANNAAVGGALIPLLTLGIPGDTATAMILAGLMMQGITPGPLLFVNSAKLVYGLFIAFIIANVAMLLLEFYGIRIFAKLMLIPKHILLSIVMAFCFIGAYGLNNRVFDVFAALLFGLVGYALKKGKFPTNALLLGFILGPTMEKNLGRGVSLYGSFWPFLKSPVCCFVLLAAVLSILWSAYKIRKNAKKKEV